MSNSPDDSTNSGGIAYALVEPTGGERAARWMVFLHGIFGSGANWRTFARRLVAQHPGWGAVLVDLRMHGASQSLAPPHTLDACARDLIGLAPALPGPVACVLGHSFGGKVALAYAAARARAGDVGLERAFVLDSLPGARTLGRGSETTLRVLELVERLRAEREPYPTREAFTGAITAEGHSLGIAQWLAMNLRRDDDGLRFKLDLAAIHALLDDYFARDLWSVVESPPDALRLNLLIGGRSPVFEPADRERAERAAAASGGRVAVDVLPDAGHWVHVDDPEGVFRVVSDAMAAAPPRP